MKPKRRSTFSPSIATPHSSAGSPPQSPRPKRKRLESTSPVRRKSSNGSDGVRPPPEFNPIDYDKACPKFADALNRDPDIYRFDSTDLLQLQYDLEMMLAHSADYCRRAHGELTFLNTGDYATQDLRSRPMPSYKLREIPTLSPTSAQEQQGICGLPTDDNEDQDDIDIWPPHHIPTRFWTWCKHEFMSNIDINVLKDFKELILDPFTPDALHDLYVNEPWKYRKRANGRARLASGSSGGSSKKRRASGDDKRKTEEKVPETPCSSNSRRSARPPKDRIPLLIGNVVDVVCREMKKEHDALSPQPCSSPPPLHPLSGRRLSGRLHSKEELDCFDGKVLVKTEAALDVLSIDVKDTEENGDDSLEPEPEHELDLTGGSPRSSMGSPRIKKEPLDEHEEVEQEMDWDKPGPSHAYVNGHGKYNGDTPKRKNGETKRMNGCHSATVTNGSSNGLTSPPNEIDPGEEGDNEEEDIEDFRTYRDIGEKILTHLIDKGLVPEYAAHVYNHMTKAEPELEVSTEGKESGDEDELDEVSEELLRCQQELKEIEPDFRGIAEHCWLKLKKDFAFHETAAQLDEADDDLFRLGVNMYREFPRRHPTPAEWPTLRAAVKRRNKKARAHYGREYKRQPEFFAEDGNASDS